MIPLNAGQKQRRLPRCILHVRTCAMLQHGHGQSDILPRRGFHQQRTPVPARLIWICPVVNQTPGNAILPALHGIAQRRHLPLALSFNRGIRIRTVIQQHGRDAYMSGIDGPIQRRGITASSTEIRICAAMQQLANKGRFSLSNCQP